MERNDDITYRWLNGESAAAIGREYEISRERVRQIALNKTRELRIKMKMPSSLWRVLLINGIEDSEELERRLEEGLILKKGGKSTARELTFRYKRKVYVNQYSNLFVFEDKRKKGTTNKKVRIAMMEEDMKMKELALVMGKEFRLMSHYLMDELPEEKQDEIIKIIHKHTGTGR